jgi:hypothetical protein
VSWRVLSGITISEERGYGEKVARGLPVVGGAAACWPRWTT